MIINILSILLFLVFIILGSIHFYWAFGGNWGIKSAIPTKNEKEDSGFRPSIFVTLLVGLVLVSIACFYFIQTNFIVIELPNWTSLVLWALPSLFLLRAIGEFKYVGFFKSIKSTQFAKWDTKLFSPLCLIISIIGFLIIFLN